MPLRSQWQMTMINISGQETNGSLPIRILLRQLTAHRLVLQDTGSIFIDDNSNVQDNSTLHTDEGHSIHIGKGVSIGHNAVVHGCTVGDNTVVGMGSIILSGAVVGKNCIIGAGALVTGKMVIPDNSMAFGNPAKVVRQLTAEEVEDNRHNAEHYVDLMNK